MRMLEKILTASDKTVVTIAATFATLVTAWTLAQVEEITFEVVVLLVANVWLAIEAVYFEED